MSVVGYLLRVASLVVVGVSLAVVGWATRRRVPPEWSGPPAHLAEVEYPAQRTAWGGFRPLTSCSAWRRALRRGRYDLLVTAAGGYGGPEPVEAGWTRGDLAATELVHEGESRVFRLDAERATRLAVRGCGS
jgi:hypothetical protein